MNSVDSREAKVVELWAKVFAASNTVIRQVAHFGFEQMHEASPNIEEIVRGLVLIEAAINAILGAGGFHHSWETERSLHNAKEQLARMRHLAGALQAGDREEFDATFALLERQLVC